MPARLRISESPEKLRKKAENQLLTEESCPKWQNEKESAKNREVTEVLETFSPFCNAAAKGLQGLADELQLHWNRIGWPLESTGSSDCQASSVVPKVGIKEDGFVSLDGMNPSASTIEGGFVTVIGITGN